MRPVNQQRDSVILCDVNGLRNGNSLRCDQRTRESRAEMFQEYGPLSGENDVALKRLSQVTRACSPSAIERM
jgi:hypothetical protein